MSSPARSYGDGMGVVMTDLFVSAAAALMIVLAVVQPTPEIPVPIQADLIAVCPSSEHFSSETAVLELLLGGTDPPDTTVAVRNSEDLVSVPAELNAPPRMYYTIALVAGPNPVTAQCLAWVQNDIIRSANRATNSGRTSGQTNPIFGLAFSTKPTP